MVQQWAHKTQMLQLRQVTLYQVEPQHKDGTIQGHHHKGGQLINCPGLPMDIRTQTCTLPMNPNYWYLYHPGPFPSQQATISQAPAQVEQGMESPLRITRSCRQRSTIPP